MNIINAKIWSAALRSGKWKQCRNKMVKNGGFCCLGVAHEVLIGPIGSEMRENYEAVDKILGLSEASETEFVTMNDEDGASFLQIADYIDEQIAAASK